MFLTFVVVLAFMSGCVLELGIINIDYYDTYPQIIPPWCRGERPGTEVRLVAMAPLCTSTYRISFDENVFRGAFVDSLELKLTVLRYFTSL